MPIEEGDNRGIDPRQKAYKDSLALYNTAKEGWRMYTHPNYYSFGNLLGEDLRGRLNEVGLLDLSYDELVRQSHLSHDAASIKDYKRPEHNPDSGNMQWFDRAATDTGYRVMKPDATYPSLAVFDRKVKNIAPINELSFLYGNWESGNTNKFRFPLYKKPTKPDRSIGRLPLLKLESDLPKTELIKQTFPKKGSSNLMDTFNVTERKQAVIEKGTGKFLRYEMVPYATKWRGEKYEMIEDAEPISRYETADERQERLGKVATTKLNNGGAPKYPNGGESKKTKDFSEVKITADDESEFAPGILELPEMQAIAPLYEQKRVMRYYNDKGNLIKQLDAPTVNKYGVPEVAEEEIPAEYSISSSEWLNQYNKGIKTSSTDRYANKYLNMLEGSKYLFDQAQNLVNTPGGRYLKSIGTSEIVENPELYPINRIDRLRNYIYNAQAYNNKLNEYDEAVELMNTIDPKTGKPKLSTTEFERLYKRKNWDQVDPNVENLTPEQQEEAKSEWYGKNYTKGNTWVDNIKDIQSIPGDINTQITNIRKAINRRRGVYDPSLSEGTGLTLKDTSFNLGDYKVKYDRNYDNFYPEGSTLLGGDFIVWSDPSDPMSNPINFPKDHPANKKSSYSYTDEYGYTPSVRTAEQWLGSPSTEPYGDVYNIGNFDGKNRRRTVGDIVSFYGVEDGKFKVGSADEFKSDTEIVPNRFDEGKTIASAKINIEKDDEPFEFYDAEGKSFGDFNNIGSTHNKIILYSKDTGESVFIAGTKEKLNKETNKFLKNNTNVIPVILDTGRFSEYSTGTGEEGKLTKDDYKNYYDLDWGKIKGKDPGYNIILDKKQDGGEILDNGGEPEKTKYLPEMTARAYDTARELVQSGKMDTNVFDNLYRRYNWAKYDPAVRKNTPEEQAELEQTWYGGYNPVAIANQVPYWLAAGAAGPFAIGAATPVVSATLAHPAVQATLANPLVRSGIAAGEIATTGYNTANAFKDFQEGDYLGGAYHTGLAGLGALGLYDFGKYLKNFTAIQKKQEHLKNLKYPWYRDLQKRKEESDRILKQINDQGLLERQRIKRTYGSVFNEQEVLDKAKLIASGKKVAKQPTKFNFPTEKQKEISEYGMKLMDKYESIKKSDPIFDWKDQFVKDITDKFGPDETLKYVLWNKAGLDAGSGFYGKFTPLSRNTMNPYSINYKPWKDYKRNEINLDIENYSPIYRENTRLKRLVDQNQKHADFLGLDIRHPKLKKLSDRIERFVPLNERTFKGSLGINKSYIDQKGNIIYDKDINQKLTKEYLENPFNINKDGGEVTIKSILDKYFTPQELENGGDVFSKPQQSDNIDTNQKGTSHITGWIEDRTPFSMPNTSEDTDIEMIFIDEYNTELTPSEEVRFNIWMDTYEDALGNKINPMDFGAYDIRGYWKSGDWEKADERGHGSDTWKKPNHPTFSEESIYSSQKGGSEYEGGTWMDDGAFIPGFHNMHSNDRLDWEFSRDEGPEYLLRGEYILPEVTVTGNTAIQGEAE